MRQSKAKKKVLCFFSNVKNLRQYRDELTHNYYMNRISATVYEHTHTRIETKKSVYHLVLMDERRVFTNGYNANKVVIDNTLPISVLEILLPVVKNQFRNIELWEVK